MQAMHISFLLVLSAVSSKNILIIMYKSLIILDIHEPNEKAHGLIFEQTGWLSGDKNIASKTRSH